MDQGKKDSLYSYYAAEEYFFVRAAHHHSGRRRAQNGGGTTTHIVVALDDLMQGPINKTDATRLLEEILEKIHENSQIRFEDGDYILTLENEDINLSLLINNANLSHLTLSPELIQRLEKVLFNCELQLLPLSPTDIVFQLLIDGTVEHPLFKLLPSIQEKAFIIYCIHGSRNINQFFRQEHLTGRRLVDNDNDSKERLAAFILGCLINDALNKIPSLADNMLERQMLNQLAYHYEIQIHELDTDEKYKVFLDKALSDGKITQGQYVKLRHQFLALKFWFPNPVVLDRGETITQETKKRRLNNPTRYPALTSFSAEPNGIDSFHGDLIQRAPSFITHHFIMK
jgi:hypothetical protein